MINKYILCINASRAKSGGAITHILGILKNLKPNNYQIKEIHVWAYKDLLDKLPKQRWLKLHKHYFLEKSLFFQLIWERFIFPSHLKKYNNNILLNLDAGSLCRYNPSFTMSRDMLSYEKGIIENYPFGFEKIRLIFLKIIQNNTLRNSNGTIFLTKYASSIIQRHTGDLKNMCYIPHGVSNFFKRVKKDNAWDFKKKKVINCLYISDILPYKNHHIVIDAVKKLNGYGINITLNIIGKNNSFISKSITKKIGLINTEKKIIYNRGHIKNNLLPKYYLNSDIFIFASSCENMPNILVEAMSTGIPIVCSNTGPMPEILEEGGIYFDPLDVNSLFKALKDIIYNKNKRLIISQNAKKKSETYSWLRCQKETFTFLENQYIKIYGKSS